jgi:hypothetical protein
MILTAMIFTAATAVASPQTPREACQADFRKFCAEVAPGGGRIKQCLAAHRAQLSEACRATLDAKTGKR